MRESSLPYWGIIIIILSIAISGVVCMHEMDAWIKVGTLCAAFVGVTVGTLIALMSF